MAEESQVPLEGVPLWPGLLTQRRLAMRAVVERRLWLGPLLVLLLVPVATAALRQSTGAPLTAAMTGQWWSDVAVGWIVTGALFVFTYVFGRVFGLRGTVGEVVLVMLWAHLPALLMSVATDAIGVAVHGHDWWIVPASKSRTEAMVALGPVAVALMALDLAASGLGLVLMLVGLSEVHRVSTGRIVLSVGLPLFVLGVVTAVGVSLLVAVQSPGVPR